MRGADVARMARSPPAAAAGRASVRAICAAAAGCASAPSTDDCRREAHLHSAVAAGRLCGHRLGAKGRSERHPVTREALPDLQGGLPRRRELSSLASKSDKSPASCSKSPLATSLSRRAPIPNSFDTVWSRTSGAFPLRSRYAPETKNPGAFAPGFFVSSDRVRVRSNG
jgi:hypothetical protein